MQKYVQVVVVVVGNRKLTFSKIAEAADDVWEVLESGGYLYICGDAASMEPAVEAALVKLITAKGTPGQPYLARLREAGRFQKDTWF